MLFWVYCMRRIGVSQLGWFLLGLAVWLLIVLLRRNGIIIPIISNHLTDFYSVPMYCILTQWLMNWRFKNKKNYINFRLIITSAINLSFAFEWLFPKLSNRFTADIYDVICYFVGGLLFYIIREKDRCIQYIKKPF